MASSNNFPLLPENVGLVVKWANSCTTVDFLLASKSAWKSNKNYRSPFLAWLEVSDQIFIIFISPYFKIPCNTKLCASDPKLSSMRGFGNNRCGRGSFRWSCGMEIEITASESDGICLHHDMLGSNIARLLLWTLFKTNRKAVQDNHYSSQWYAWHS